MMRITERIDQFPSIVFVPVPVEVMKATENRIQDEMEILRNAGENPAHISAYEADKILGKIK